MKNILLIATGGTIACSSSDEGLTPSANVNELLSYIPHIKEKCKLSGISIMNIDSTNMNPELMMNIAKAIKEYRDNYDGFVVAHGTDTMGYTAAALVYMLKNFNKPVVITGSPSTLTIPSGEMLQPSLTLLLPLFARPPLDGLFFT